MLNVAIVGLGWWGRNIVGQLRGNRTLQPVVLVDVNQQAGGEFAGSQELPFVADLAQALADPRVQGVVLCT
ncbi:MAG: Gfo/Idh/MocA family oxidoreductase, partial [Pseudomonadota bacterium]|nr:Gfo/Idh/MocA family oxidoreductase [Pseudomonadota bacterium]